MFAVFIERMQREVRRLAARDLAPLLNKGHSPVQLLVLAALTNADGRCVACCGVLWRALCPLPC